MKDQTIEQYYSLLISLLQGKMIQCTFKDNVYIGQFCEIHKHIDCGINLANCVRIDSLGKLLHFPQVIIANICNPSRSGNYIATKIELVGNEIHLITTGKYSNSEQVVVIEILGEIYKG